MNKISLVFENIATNLSVFVDYVIIIKYGNSTLKYNSVEKDPIKFIKTQSIQNIKITLDIFDNHYYNTDSPIVSDSTYDLLSDYYYNNTDDSKSNKIGVAVKSQKVKLPIYMGSMDKVKLGQSRLSNF